MVRVFSIVFLICINLNAEIRVNKIKGKVDFIGAKGEILSVKEGDTISENTTIKTSSSSEVEIVYDKGAMIFLSENSYFTVRLNDKTISSSFFDILTLNLYAEDESNESWIDYLYGKAMFFIKKLDKTYSVKTPTAILGVRGTNFVVVTDENISEIGLFKGSVEIEKDGKKFELKPGQSAFITKQDVRIEERLSSLMEKEKKRAAKLEKYFENVMLKLKKREELLRKKIQNLDERLKQ